MPSTGKTKRGARRPARRVESFDVCLTSSWPPTRDPLRTWIFCPWLDRFAAKDGLWLSVLAVHDANGALLERLPSGEKRRPNVYAAVFAVDALRSWSQILRALDVAGVGGVINLPSTTFIDGRSGEALNHMALGSEHEFEFLGHCAREGFSIAGVVNSSASAQRCAAIGAAFLIAHGGPPTQAQPDPDSAVVAAIRGSLDASIPVVAISQLQTRRARAS